MLRPFMIVVWALMTTCIKGRPLIDTELRDAVWKWQFQPNEATETYGHTSTWDTSQVSNMAGLFRNAEFKHVASNAIKDWDTSMVTNMSHMFSGARNFDHDVHAWNVAKVKDMHAMFAGASSFNKNLSAWNVAKVEDMSYMFFMADRFDGDSAWNVAEVKFMNSMFHGAFSFNQNLSAWNVAKVWSMIGMFQFASNFNQDLSAWSVGRVTSMQAMFRGALSFNQNLSRWMVNVSSGGFELMFEGACTFWHDISMWPVCATSCPGIGTTTSTTSPTAATSPGDFVTGRPYALDAPAVVGVCSKWSRPLPHTITISRNIIVEKFQSLRIEAGMHLEYSGCFTIKVQAGGVLTVTGTEESPVRLVGPTTACGTSHTALLKQKGGTLFLMHASIEHFGTGAFAHGGGLTVRSSTFLHNGCGLICQEPNISRSHFEGSSLRDVRVQRACIITDSTFKGNVENFAVSSLVVTKNITVEAIVEAKGAQDQTFPYLLVAAATMAACLPFVWVVLRFRKHAHAPREAQGIPLLEQEA